MDKSIQAKIAVGQFAKVRKMHVKGYVNKVSALPENVKEHIDKLLMKGVANTAIAREINRRFHLKETFEYGELSNWAITTYKKRWEKKQAQKEVTKEVMFDASVFIKDWTNGATKLEVAEKLRTLIQDQFDLLNDLKKKLENTPLQFLPDKLEAIQLVRKNAFEFIAYYISLGQSMGLIPKTILPEGGVGAGQFKFIGDPETLKAIMKMLEAHEKRVNRKKNE